MLQEHVIVNQMPGRPNTQKPAQRVPPSQNGSFGPSPVNGKGWCPPLKSPPMRPLSVKQVIWRDVHRSKSDPESGTAPMMTTAQQPLPLPKWWMRIRWIWPQKDSHLFQRCPSGIPPRTTYTTTRSTWTTSSTVWTLAISSTIWSWFVATSRLNRMAPAYHLENRICLSTLENL